MASPKIIEQAKAGDVNAITQLLNANLNPKGIQITAQPIRQGTLSLALVGKAVASQETMEKYLKSAFQKLAAPSIQIIELSYSQHDHPTKPSWQSQIELASSPASIGERPTVAVSEPTLANASPTQPVAPVAAPKTVATEKASSPQRYANPLSIWLQWQATSFGALLLIYLLGVGISSLVMVPLLSRSGGSLQWNGAMGFLGLGALALILMPIAGLVIGDGQTRLLRKWLHRIGGWRWMTPLGGVLGFAVAVGIHFVGYSLAGSAIMATADDAADVFIQGGIAVAICSGLGIGLGFLTLGFFQWLMLQGSVPKAHQWIWSNAIASVLSLFFGLVAGILLTKQLLGDVASGDSFTWLVVVFLGSTVSWFLFNGFTGITMARLLSKVPLREE